MAHHSNFQPQPEQAHYTSPGYVPTLSHHAKLLPPSEPTTGYVLLIFNMNEIKVMSKQELSTCFNRELCCSSKCYKLYNHDCTT